MSVLCDLGISMLKQQSLWPFCLFSCGDGGISITVAVTLLLVSEKQRLWYRWASQQPKISPDLAITQFELSLPAHISDTITALIIYRRIRIKRYCICKQINGPRVNNYNASIEEVHNTKCISHKINSINLKSPRSCWRQRAGESFFRWFLPCLCSESVESLRKNSERNTEVSRKHQRVKWSEVLKELGVRSRGRRADGASFKEQPAQPAPAPAGYETRPNPPAPCEREASQDRDRAGVQHRGPGINPLHVSV